MHVHPSYAEYIWCIGKYRGRRLSEIPRSYFGWLVNQILSSGTDYQEDYTSALAMKWYTSPESEVYDNKLVENEAFEYLANIGDDNVQ